MRAMWRLLLLLFCLGFLSFQISGKLGLLLWGLIAVLWAGWVLVLLWQILSWAPSQKN